MNLGSEDRRAGGTSPADAVHPLCRCHTPPIRAVENLVSHPAAGRRAERELVLADDEN